MNNKSKPPLSRSAHSKKESHTQLTDSELTSTPLAALASTSLALSSLKSSSNQLVETSLTLVSEGTRIEGLITFDSIARVHGVLIGKVVAQEGSTLILNETAVVEGEIEADVLLIDGFVQGKISATTRVYLSRTGRVIGDIHSPSFIVEHGAFFEGKVSMAPLNLPISQD